MCSVQQGIPPAAALAAQDQQVVPAIPRLHARVRGEAAARLCKSAARMWPSRPLAGWSSARNFSVRPSRSASLAKPPQIAFQRMAPRNLSSPYFPYEDMPCAGWPGRAQNPNLKGQDKLPPTTHPSRNTWQQAGRLRVCTTTLTLQNQNVMDTNTRQQYW